MFPAVAKGAAFTALAGHVRGMATLKDIRVRLKSVKNIQKITQSMKMVSAAKYARAERDLKQARPYGQGAKAFYEQANIEDEAKPSTLLLAMTSDRGLCGAVHSGVTKKIKAIIGEGGDVKVICVGDKARGLLQRTHSKNILMAFSEYGKKPPHFEDATKVATAIIESEIEFEKGLIVFNRFRSVVSYQTTEVPMFSLKAISAGEKLPIYDSIDEDVLRSYQEYSLASLIFYAMKENACSEQSSRMTAMDGASKNAGEVIQKLTLTFNRTRQAVITKELIEIISGAAAL